MIVNYFSCVPEHVGMICTGLYGSHAMCTGRVSRYPEAQYSVSYSREQTIYKKSCERERQRASNACLDKINVRLSQKFLELARAD